MDDKEFDKKLRDSQQKRARTLSDVIEEKKHKSDKKPEKEEPLYLKKERSIKYSVKDGLFSSMKSGLTSSFVMPFAIALNATTGMLALLSSVPSLVQSFVQLFAQDSLKIFKTRGRQIFWTAFIQSFMWLPMIFIPMIAGKNIQLGFLLLLIFVTLEGTISSLQGPIYNSILGDIIDDNKRGEFFGKRNRVVNFMGFVTTFIAGLVLTIFKGFDNNGTAHYVFFGFGILFFFAFVFRLIASYFKTKIYDPPYNPPKDKITFFNFIKNMTHNNYGVFVLYVFLFQMSVNISTPFFALYLLRDMQFSYMYFTLITAASILSGFIAMGYWGRVIDKNGSKGVLMISGLLVPLSPFLLFLAIFIKNPAWLFIYVFLEETLSGAVWAGFNLSASAFLFDATSKDERVKYISYYNFLVGVAVFVGAMIGGLLIREYPALTIAATLVTSAIPIIYLTTGSLRLLMTVIFMKKVQEARMVEIDFPGRGFFHRVIAINPRFGSNIAIVGVYHGKEHRHFHNVLPPKKPEYIHQPDKPDDKKLYEKKSFEYYRQNALKTMNQKDRQMTPKDDSERIESGIESDKKRISELAEKINTGRLRKK